MPRDFFPRRDHDVLVWSANFSKRLSADPGLYGIAPERAAGYAALHAAFADAQRRATEPSTRTSPSIVARNDARRRLEAEARRIAGCIRARRTVTPQMRIDLGLSVRDGGGRSPRIGPPASAPSLHIVAVRGRTVTIRLLDADNTAHRAKPRGVRGAILFRGVGDPAATDPTIATSPVKWIYSGQTTKTTLDITFDDPSLVPGTKVWLAAQWTNPRGQLGPTSDPAYAHLGYALTGGPTARAA